MDRRAASVASQQKPWGPCGELCIQLSTITRRLSHATRGPGIPVLVGFHKESVKNPNDVLVALRKSKLLSFQGAPNSLASQLEGKLPIAMWQCQSQEVGVSHRGLADLRLNEIYGMVIDSP